MAARYLLRFDDICPTMNWAVWDEIELALERNGILPLVAIVPDNRDPKLAVSTPRIDFWKRVRTWQAKGWAIGLHGYQHRYETHDAGLIGLNPRSEFAGLPRAEQQRRIAAGLAIFSREGVRADLWIAPAHSFDRQTVQALLAEGISVISDGFFFRPVRRLGALWVPQQLWGFRELPFGLWTVCIHPNGFTAEETARLCADIARYRGAITSLREVLAGGEFAEYGLADRVFERAWRSLLAAKHILKTLPLS